MVCQVCQATFEHDYLLWIHTRNHIPKELRLLCPFCPFVTSKNCEQMSSVSGGVSLLTSHIKNTHFKAIKCRICQVFVAESRAEMSRHVYRTHMYDKKFYTKQFSKLFLPHTTSNMKDSVASSHQQIHSATEVEKIDNKISGQLCPQQQDNQNNFSSHKNIYCAL